MSTKNSLPILQALYQSLSLAIPRHLSRPMLTIGAAILLFTVFLLLLTACSGGPKNAQPTPVPEFSASPSPSPVPDSPFIAEGAACRSMVRSGNLEGIYKTSNAKLIAMTFDDGPSKDSVAFVNELNKLGVRCTFFMQGHLIEAYPEAVRAMVEGGHQVASHSYNHPNLATLSPENVKYQINTTEDLLSDIDGKNGHYLRCPYGESSDTVKSIADGPIIHWNVDSMDWSSLNRDAVRESIVNNSGDGSIVLAHEIYPTSREGTLDAIEELLEDGYEFVTVEELLLRRGVEILDGETYFDAYNEGINLPADAVEPYFGTFAEGYPPQGSQE